MVPDGAVGDGAVADSAVGDGNGACDVARDAFVDDDPEPDGSEFGPEVGTVIGGTTGRAVEGGAVEGGAVDAPLCNAVPPRSGRAA